MSASRRGRTGRTACRSWPTRRADGRSSTRNDFQKGLGTVYEAVSTYYSIGVNLSGLTVGKYEKVAVSVNRPGVTGPHAPRLRGAARGDRRVADSALATLQTDLDLHRDPGADPDRARRPRRQEALQPADHGLVAGLGADLRAATATRPRPSASFYIGAIDDKGRMSDIAPAGVDVRDPGGQGRLERASSATRRSSRRRRATTGSSSTSATSRPERWGRRGRTCGSSDASSSRKQLRTERSG